MPNSNSNANRVQYRLLPETMETLQVIAEVMADKAPWQGKVSQNEAAKYAMELGVQVLRLQPGFQGALASIPNPETPTA